MRLQQFRCLKARFFSAELNLIHLSENQALRGGAFQCILSFSCTTLSSVSNCIVRPASVFYPD